jgi:hypothetical protein
MSNSPKMQKWFKVTTGTMVRCWCWTETEEGRIDNGWRHHSVNYPHAPVCDRNQNPYTEAYYLLYTAASEKHVLDNDIVSGVLQYLAKQVFQLHGE